MPSRTSVSLDGRAVVVANRRGGLTKVWARTEFCQDHNGIAGIQTSTGADDVRPWGDDECVAWYTEFPEATNQRPVAWTSGVLDEVSCEYEGQKIWTVTGRGSTADDGMCQGNGIWIHRLDGDTGVVEDTIALPDVPCSTETNGQGPYGGAVDSQNHFWFHLYDQEPLYRVDFETLEVTSFTMPHKAYGIMVDRQDRIWINRTKSNDHTTSVFSPLTGLWASIDGVGRDGGLAEDLEGRVWVADGQAGVMWIDSDTLEVGGTVAIPGPAVNDSIVKGVSVDTDGYVWAIRRYEPDDVMIDPTTFELETYTGLDRPYTYSDMTGSQLSKVACGPAG
jgi:streptogramin lyase